MNWYKKIKLAQIWKVENDGSFADWIKAIYELEYKLQALNNFKFKGNPERKENIINNVEANLGHDGIILDNNYVVFDSSQIKVI